MPDYVVFIHHVTSSLIVKYSPQDFVFKHTLSLLFCYIESFQYGEGPSFLI